MSGAQKRRSEGRERLVADLATECWQRGWTFTISGEHVFVHGRRVLFSAFEEDFKEALNSLADLIRSSEARAHHAPHLSLGLSGQEFDQGGRHISDKSG